MLKSTLQAENKYHLQEKPHLISNIDEKGITLNHKPSNVSSGCGNASGFALPPCFVFEEKRMMNGATHCAVGAVSDPNTNIFLQYLTDHFLNYVETMTTYIYSLMGIIHMLQFT